MPASHRFIPINGLRLHLLDFGGSAEELPTVLCLHGVTGHAWAWEAVADLLVGRARVIALDQRGHGDSQWSRTEAYTTADLVGDLKALVDAEGAHTAHVVGLSWGGLVGIELAAESPLHLRSLVVVDAPPSSQQSPTEVPERPMSFADHGEVWAAERQANPNAPDGMVGSMAAFGTRPGPGGTLVRKHDPYFARNWPFRGEDHWDAWRAVGVPTTLVRAAGSPVLDEATFAQMGEAQPKAKLETVEDSGHLVPVENPGALAEVVAAHVDAHTG